MFAEISTNNTIPELTSCMEEYSDKELIMSMLFGVTKDTGDWNSSWEKVVSESINLWVSQIVSLEMLAHLKVLSISM